METNYLFILLAALVPLVMGFVWYHKNVFGTAWMKGVGVSEEVLAKGPNPIVFLFAFILSFMLAMMMNAITSHQYGIFSLFLSEPGFGEAGSEIQQQFDGLMNQFRGKDENFGHGAFHGALIGIFMAFPILATNGMFEFKSWKHNAINVGYWVVTLTLVGGIVNQFA